MSNEKPQSGLDVKRYCSGCNSSYEQTVINQRPCCPDSDGKYVLYSDWKLERKAREVAEKKLNVDKPSAGDGKLFDGEKWIDIAPTMEAYAVIRLAKALEKAEAEVVHRKEKYPFAWNDIDFRIKSELNKQQIKHEAENARYKAALESILKHRVAMECSETDFVKTTAQKALK